MKYSEAYNLIIDAYFKDEIRPWKPKFCFCGTLAPDSNWLKQTWKWNNASYPYLMKEYVQMENALLEPLGLTMRDGEHYTVREDYLCEGLRGYEDALFRGMCAALDVLKSIHESRGEIIEPTTFKKRELMGTPGRD